MFIPTRANVLKSKKFRRLDSNNLLQPAPKHEFNGIINADTVKKNNLRTHPVAKIFKLQFS